MFRAIALLVAAAVWVGPLHAAGTRVLFDTADPNVGPFPSDALTVSDPAQNTGLRVNLPLPDCQAEPSTCTEISLINELDGFNINARIRVRFSGPIDVETLRSGIFFVFLGGVPGDGYRADRLFKITPINQVLYDPATNTAYAKPNELLFEHSHYALVVTSAIRDVVGDPVVADPAYLAYLASLGSPLVPWGLRRTVAGIAHLFPDQIVAASSFTTVSATLWLEKARDQLENSPIGLEWTGPKSVFRISEMTSMTGQYQTQVNPPGFRPRQFPLRLLNGVGRVAFGSYLSPSFLNQNLAIPATPTGDEVALPTTAERIHFHVFLPDSAPPADGYPVVIAPGNAGGERIGHSTQYASSFARHGMATIAANVVGAGNGPEGKLLIQEKTGNTVELPLPGRGADLNGDKTIATNEGCTVDVTRPVPVYARDCFRQTALDLQQLVRAIKAGIDLDGDGVVDLDRNRIYYHGMSTGGGYGPILAAISPDVTAAVFDAGGGPLPDVWRWLKAAGPLGLRKPPLLNKGNTYDEDYVLRDRPVAIIDVPGALAIQECLERYEWFMSPGDSTAYAALLRSATPPGTPVKGVLFQYAKGDRNVPNPTETALVRAANKRETTSFYRHDLALKLFPNLNPAGHYHTMIDLSPYPALMTDPLPQYVIALLAQEQAAGFLASGGTVVPDVSSWSRMWFGVNLFEAPPETLTEDLN